MRMNLVLKAGNTMMKIFLCYKFYQYILTSFGRIEDPFGMATNRPLQTSEAPRKEIADRAEQTKSAVSAFDPGQGQFVSVRLDNVLHLQRIVGNTTVRRMLAEQRPDIQRDSLDASATPITEAQQQTPTPIPAQDSDAGPQVDTVAPEDSSQSAMNGNTASDSAKEAKFAADADYLINRLGTVAIPDSGGGGHSAGAEIDTYPDWFNIIQKRLNFGTSWGDTEELAQNLLHDYAVYRATRENGGRLPPSLEVFFRYLGRSKANLKENTDYANAEAQTYDDVPTASDLGAGQGFNWCAMASYGVFVKALAEKGMKPLNSKTVSQKWINSNKLQITTSQASTAELEAGDSISLVGPNTPPSGHVATVVSASGDDFMMVSGNTTFVTGGGTSLEKMRRQNPPDDFKWKLTAFDSVYKDPAKLKEKREEEGYFGPLKPPTGADYVWIVSIVRLGKAMPDNLESMSDEELAKIGVQRIKN
jgi:hypothetical protein